MKRSNLNTQLGKLITPFHIVDFFQELTGVTLEEIRSKNSTARVVDVRKAMVPLLEELCDYRYTDIMHFMDKKSGVIGNYMTNIKPLHMDWYTQAKDKLKENVNNYYI